MFEKIANIIIFFCCPFLNFKFSSTQNILRVMALTRLIFWSLILFLFYYITTHLENPSPWVLLGAGLALFPLWLDREDFSLKSSSYVKGLDLYVGDKIGFLMGDKREEGELTKMYIDMFEFTLNNGKLRIARWSYFEENRPYFLDAKAHEHSTEMVEASYYFIADSDALEAYKKRLEEKIEEDSSLAGTKVYFEKFHYDTVKVTSAVEVPAGKRDVYAMHNSLNYLMMSGIKDESPKLRTFEYLQQKRSL